MLCRIMWCMVQRSCYTYPAWGFGVARFDRQGNAKASDREASNSAGLHALLITAAIGNVLSATCRAHCHGR